MPELTEHDAELLSAYINGELTADEAATLEQRLTEDAFLRRELAALRQIVSLIQALPEVKAPRNFTLTPDMVAVPTKPVSQRQTVPTTEITPATMVALPKAAPAQKQINKTAPRRRMIWQPLAAAAAVFVVAVGFMAVLFSNQAQPMGTVAAAPTQSTFSNVIIAEEMPVTTIEITSVKEPAEAIEESLAQGAAPPLDAVTMSDAAILPTPTVAADAARANLTPTITPVQPAVGETTGGMIGDMDGASANSATGTEGMGGDPSIDNQTTGFSINPDPNMSGFTVATLQPDALYYAAMTKTPLNPEVILNQYNPIPAVAAQATFAAEMPPVTAEMEAESALSEMAAPAESPASEMDNTVVAPPFPVVPALRDTLILTNAILLLQWLVNMLTTGQP